ncbi:formyltransferase family protein [Candidatus Omnitrophota bacterium]
MGGRQAGVIGALSMLSMRHEILRAVSYSDDLKEILNIFNIPMNKSINDKDFIEDLKKVDLLISVHGREIVKKDILKLPKYGAINLHPYLYKYKGADPIGRALKDKNFKASVGAHFMTEEADEGEVLIEEFIDVSGSESVTAIYNMLYPYYSKVLLSAILKVQNEIIK